MSTENVDVGNAYVMLTDKGHAIISNYVGSSRIEFAATEPGGDPPAADLWGHRLKAGETFDTTFEEGDIYARTMKPGKSGIVVVTSKEVGVTP